MINKKERILRLIGVTIILGLVIFIIFSSDKYNRFSVGYKKQDALNNIYQTSFWGIIELSNEIFKLYEIQNEPVFYEGHFLTQLEYLRKKTEPLLLKLEKIPEKEKVQSSIEICKGILSFIDLYTSGKNKIEQERNEAKGVAEFKIVLDKLQDFISQTRGDWGKFSKYTLAMFSDDAVSKYRAMQLESDKKYSIYLWFGYYLYDAIEKNLETEYK